MKTQGLNNLPCSSFTRPREARYHVHVITKEMKLREGGSSAPNHTAAERQSSAGGLTSACGLLPGWGLAGGADKEEAEQLRNRARSRHRRQTRGCPALRPPSPSSGSRQENVRKPRPGAPPSRPRRRPAPDPARPPAPRRSRPRTPRPLRSGSALAASHRCPHGSWSLLRGRCGPSRAAGQRSPMPGAQSCVTARGGREDSERHRDAAACKDQLIPAPRSGLTAPCRPTRGLSLWSHSFPGQRKPLRDRQLPWKGLSLRSQVPRLMSFFPGGRAGNETAQA